MRPVKPPIAETRQPKLKAPPGACDAHLHVYGPPQSYPLAPDRNYNPDPRSTLEDYLKVHRTLGLERAVIVTGSANGTNNQRTLDALARMKGKFKGLALLDPAITDEELLCMKESGVTGFRVKADGRGGLSFADSEKMAARVDGFGWHVEFMSQSLEEVIAAMPFLRRLGAPYALDHVAHAEPHSASNDAKFRELLRVLGGEEHAWINLYSFYQLSEAGPPNYEDMVQVIRAIIDARPGRVIWGSNWPHAGIRAPMPNDADLLDFLLLGAPDEATRKQILCDNPARLYGWLD